MGDRPGSADQAKFLIVRIDGIGDLICITPLLDALRRHYPTARIDLMANEYNADVILGNQNINHLYIDYRTRDRLTNRRNPLKALRKLAQITALRHVGYDCAIAAHFGEHSRALRQVRMVKARRIIQSVERESVPAFEPNVVNVRAVFGVHETLGCFELLRPLGITDAPGPLRIHPAAAHLAVAQERRRVFAVEHALTRLIGINLSASAVTRAWPLEKYIGLMELVAARLPGTGYMLFWAGASAYGASRADDRGAAAAMRHLPKLPILEWASRDVPELVAGIAVCDFFVTSDGGPLHMAAALGKPVVGFFERQRKKLDRWYPWQVPARVLHSCMPAGFNVSGIAVDDAVEALADLVSEIETGRA